MFIAMSLLVPTSHAAEIVKLPEPDKTSGKPLMEVINTRKTGREFSKKALDEQTLSEILWAAYGSNNHGTRTIPTARNEQNLKVYAIMADGAWLYNGEKHQLELVVKDDLRKLLAKQDYVKDAPLTIVYTGSNQEYSALHAGSSYQNVSLYAASKGLSAVVRGFFDKDEIKKALKLPKDEFAIITITVGY